MNDRKKTILLLLLVFAVFGLAGWRIAGIPGQTTPPSGPQSVSLDSNGQPVATDTAPGISVGVPAKPSSASKGVAIAPPSPVAGPDPFRTAAKPEPTLHIQPQLVALPKPVSHAPPAIHSSDLDQPVSPLKGDILPSPAGSPVEVHADAAPALRVSGVLTGDKPIAIMKLGDQQFVVSIGEVFGDGYVLRSVSTTQVVVTQGKKTLFLATVSM